jgi:putative membrane-bound dehydrogenase-like protein
VKCFFLGLAGLGLLGVAFSPLAAQQKTDYHQQQSPPRPKPTWLKIIDQGKNNPRLKGYFTPEGIKVEIVADYPVVTNPVGMTFGADGTLYVLEWRPGPQDANFPEYPETIRYKDGSKRTIATMRKVARDAKGNVTKVYADVVKVLRDTKGKGIYDKAEILLEEELPSSILLHDGWLYLSGRGTVRRYKQSKPGGKYDVREVIAQGFCGYHHHQVSGLTIGNDGWLYITSGDDDNYVEGSDGSRATVLRTGAIFRCRPDGSKMHVFSIGYRNPYRDVAFDTAGNIFHADNDNEDGSKFTGCRVMHVAEATDFGWRLKIGARCCVADHMRGAVFGELPGKMPALLKTGRGAPAGLLIYNDTRFPEQYRGLLYYPDVFRKLIRAYRVEPKGTSFTVAEEFEFLRSDDPLFRPCQMVLGPDGAMYICDWRTDSGGAGRLWGDNRHGRIYRVSWAGTGKKDEDGNEIDPALPLRGLDSWAKIVKLSDADLFKTLGSKEFSDRQRAQHEVVRRGVKHRPALLKLVANREQSLAARMGALGALQAFWNEDVAKAFCKLVEDNEADLRRLAAEGLALNCKEGDQAAHQALLGRLDDAEPDVRRAVALAMGRIAAPGAADALVNAFKFDTGKDVYLQDGLVRAIERLGKVGIQKLMELAESGVDSERNKVVDAFLALRTRPAVLFLETLLKNPHLTVAQRAGLIRSYSNYLLDPPIKLGAMVAYLSKHPKEDAAVKLAGLEVLSSSRSLLDAKARTWVLDRLDETDTGVRLAAIKAVKETGLSQAALRLAARLGDGDRPVQERQAIAQALRGLHSREAVPVLKKFLAENQAQAASIRIEVLRTLGALDPAAGEVVARSFLKQGNLVLQRGAAEVIGQQAAGAKFLGKRFLAKKLPPELQSPVAEALRKHAGRDAEAAKLLAEIRKLGLQISLKDRAAVARLTRRILTRGDPQKGKVLYLSDKNLACIRCHRLEGVGGSIGPDLTRLWETQSVEKIMESILEPSKEIKEGYQTYQAETKKGQVFIGLKISQTKEAVVLRDANGTDVRIAAKDLADLTALKTSLMPDDAVKQLTFDQFIDLVAFLKNRAAQESLRGLVYEYWVVGPFGDDLKTAYAPEKNPDPTATYAGAKAGEKLSWQAQLAEANGLLNLKTIFGRENISAYVLTYVYSPKAQKVKMLVGSDDTVRLWLNGKMVHEYTTPRSAVPDSDEVAVQLKQGWNTVLAKVVNHQLDHGLYLRFAGAEGLRVARKPEGK